MKKQRSCMKIRLRLLSRLETCSMLSSKDSSEKQVSIHCLYLLCHFQVHFQACQVPLAILDSEQHLLWLMTQLKVQIWELLPFRLILQFVLISWVNKVLDLICQASQDFQLQWEALLHLQLLI